MRDIPPYANDLLSPISYLRPALDIPTTIMRKWDAQYPRGLVGEEMVARRLPWPWRCLLSDRPYGAAWSGACKPILPLSCGTHFDPDGIPVFLGLEAAPTA